MVYDIGPPFEFFVVMSLFLFIFGVVCTLILIACIRRCIFFCRRNNAPVLITSTTIIPNTMNPAPGTTTYAFPVNYGNNVPVNVTAYPQYQYGPSYPTQYRQPVYQQASAPVGFAVPSYVYATNPPSYDTVVR